MPKKTPHKPPAKTLDEFVVPSTTRLQQAAVVSGAISKIIADDEAVDAFHHKMVHHGIGSRVDLALALASDKQAFANFVKDARIKALPRPPKDASDTLRCLLQATYLDPKKASKYYKRIEPLWEKRCPAADVLAFLEKNGVSKPSRKVLPGPRKPGSGKTAQGAAEPHKTSKAAAGDEGKDDRVSASTMDEGDTPCGTIYFWPDKLKAGRVYNLRVKILDDEDDMANFDLLDILPPAA